MLYTYDIHSQIFVMYYTVHSNSKITYYALVLCCPVIVNLYEMENGHVNDRNCVSLHEIISVYHF